ncbi:hypothetical protein AB9K32_12695 [Allomuricauda sp. XS_ASV26]|uniref:hypothetical protein n=1 Tax=Allomuricauda sp. XS_ASV26 TaxID=3241292 RepID=UPI0035185950
MKSNLIFAIITVFLFACSEKEKGKPNENLSESKLDTINYSYSAMNMGFSLNLISNGRFSSEEYDFSCLGGGERTMVFGKYKKSSDGLKLFPERVEFIEYSEVMVPKPMKQVLNPRLDSLRYKTSYHVIEWNNHEYLLSEVYGGEAFPEWGIKKENDFIRFSEYYNSGFEPEEHGAYLVSMDQTYNSTYQELNLDQIPEQWQSYFLKEPISARILSIQKVTHPYVSSRFTWLVELDKGLESNVTDYLSFEDRFGNHLMNVTKVTKDRSYGYLFYSEIDPQKLPINLELRTKWQ